MKEDTLKEIYENPFFKKTMENLSEEEQNKIKNAVVGFVSLLEDSIVGPLLSLREDKEKVAEIEKHLKMIVNPENRKK